MAITYKLGCAAAVLLLLLQLTSAASDKECIGVSPITAKSLTDNKESSKTGAEAKEKLDVLFKSAATTFELLNNNSYCYNVTTQTASNETQSFCITAFNASIAIGHLVVADTKTAVFAWKYELDDSENAALEKVMKLSTEPVGIKPEEMRLLFPQLQSSSQVLGFTANDPAFCKESSVEFFTNDYKLKISKKQLEQLKSRSPVPKDKDGAGKLKRNTETRTVPKAATAAAAAAGLLAAAAAAAVTAPVLAR